MTQGTRKRKLLVEIDLLVPCVELVFLLTPQAQAPGAGGGRPPFAFETILRVHFLHVWIGRLLHAP